MRAATCSIDLKLLPLSHSCIDPNKLILLTFDCFRKIVGRRLKRCDEMLKKIDEEAKLIDSWKMAASEVLLCIQDDDSESHAVFCGSLSILPFTRLVSMCSQVMLTGSFFFFQIVLRESGDQRGVR